MRRLPAVLTVMATRRRRTAAVHALVCALLLVLSGCSHDPRRVIVVEHSAAGPTQGNYYTVHRGDTLYSIAWRFDREYRALADANNLSSPYLIRPGQRIYVGPPRARRQPATGSGRAPSYPRAAAPDRDLPEKSVGHWHWPAAGAVVARFSNRGKIHKGIDIRGKIGEPVRASKAGRVVYAGKGIPAYGLLIIVKHDQHFLSAYAYNRKALVSEGERVSAGQQIAQLGVGNDGKPRLHFEIRQDGKPVDPLRLLPRR